MMRLIQMDIQGKLLQNLLVMSYSVSKDLSTTLLGSKMINFKRHLEAH